MKTLLRFKPRSRLLIGKWSTIVKETNVLLWESITIEKADRMTWMCQITPIALPTTTSNNNWTTANNSNKSKTEPVAAWWRRTRLQERTHPETKLSNSNQRTQAALTTSLLKISQPRSSCWTNSQLITKSTSLSTTLVSLIVVVNVSFRGSILGEKNDHWSS